MNRDARGRVTALCLCAAALVATLQCAESPESPERTNPLDPGGASAGDDALDLRANLSGSSVSLLWRAVPIEGRSGARVYRLDRDGEDFDYLGEVPGVGFLDNEPHRDTLNVYAVTILNDRGEEAPLDAFAHDTIDVPPLLVIGTEEEPLDSTTTRLVHVEFYSERAESVFLSDSSVTADGVTQLVSPTGYLPNPAGYDFLLHEGAPTNHMRTVFGRTRRTDGTLSPIVSDAVAFPAPSLAISVEGDGVGPFVTGRKSVAVTLAAAGAESMEVTFDSTFSDVWSPFAAVFEESLPGPGARLLRARVRDTFGAVAQDTFRVVGDTLESVRLLIDGGAAQTRLCTGTVAALDGKVLQICLSSAPIDSSATGTDPGCNALVPYNGPIEGWSLKPCADVARVYARVANDWVPEGRVVTLTDDIYVVGGAPELEIQFPDPVGSDTLRIGEPAELRGFAKAGSCWGAIDYVRLSVHFERDSIPETLAIGDATLVPDSADVSRSAWSTMWTPPASIPSGRSEIFAVLSVDSICGAVRSAVATLVGDDR
jgi:hypothetical protein